MLEVLLLYLIIPGRINFLQLEHYGRFGEQRYWQQPGRKFDWLSFNSCLVSSHIGKRVAIAFDSSYISKSGQCPPPPILDPFGQVVPRWKKGNWKYQALESLTWIFTVVFIWRPSKRHRKNAGIGQVDIDRLVFACVAYT